MIQLSCPWCGIRNVAEFGYAGEAVRRPDPATATPGQWRDYLYFRRNPRGWVRESWYHRAGCRRYFRLDRDTVSNETRPADGPDPAGSTDPTGSTDTAGGTDAAEGAA